MQLLSGLQARLRAVTGSTLVWNIAAYAGSVARSLKSKNDDVLSVKDFYDPADGDNWQLAFDRLSAACAANKCAAFIPYGNYTNVRNVKWTGDTVAIYGYGNLIAPENQDGIRFEISANRVSVTGSLRFTGPAHANADWPGNDTIRVNAAEQVLIEGVRIYGSRGGGIIVFAPDAKILNNYVYNCFQCNILVGNNNGNNILIHGNTCKGSETQNNIFTTADSSSGPTYNAIQSIIITNNHCLGAEDTAIELGQQSYSSIVANNYCQDSVNPLILVRDNHGVVVQGNTLRNADTARQNVNYSAIAIVPANQPASMDQQAIIADNVCLGAVRRCQIYLGAVGVDVHGNRIMDDTTAIDNSGNQLAGSGILIGIEGDITQNINIYDNTITNHYNGIDYNFTGTPMTATNVRVTGNRITGSMQGIVAYNVTFKAGEISRNTFRKMGLVGVKLAASVFKGELILSDNVFQMAGYNFRGPVKYDLNGAGQFAGILASPDTNYVPVPDVTFGYTLVADAINQNIGLAVVQFDDLSESGVFAIAGGTVVKLHGTANLLGSDGAGGNAGWALYPDPNFGNALSFKRFGPNDPKNGLMCKIKLYTAA